MCHQTQETTGRSHTNVAFVCRNTNTHDTWQHDIPGASLPGELAGASEAALEANRGTVGRGDVEPCAAARALEGASPLGRASSDTTMSGGDIVDMVHGSLRTGRDSYVITRTVCIWTKVSLPFKRGGG
jgi:hypothetical protein